MTKPHSIEPRVVIISHNYPSAVEPTSGIFVHNEVRALQQSGIDVRVVSPTPWSPFLLRFRDKWRRYAAIRNATCFEDVDVERAVCPLLPRPCNHLNGLSLAAGLLPCLRRLRREFPFNIIHSHTLTPDGWAGCLLAKRFGVPSVCTIRGSDLLQYPHESRVAGRASRYALRRSSAIITTSKDLAEKAIKLEANAVPPTTIYKGVDMAIFRSRATPSPVRVEQGIPKEATLVVFVGRCEKDKGLGELLDAFVALESGTADVRLLIVGDGEYRSEMESTAFAHGVADRVQFVGRVPQPDVVGYLQASDIFVLPSYSEGMPNALLEAMACGLPCIASSVGGNVEAIEDGISGLLVPPRDDDTLRSAMQRLLCNAGMATPMGEQAEQRIRQCFSWSENAAQNANVYRRVLQSDGCSE